MSNTNPIAHLGPGQGTLPSIQSLVQAYRHVPLIGSKGEGNEGFLGRVFLEVWEGDGLPDHDSVNLAITWDLDGDPDPATLLNSIARHLSMLAGRINEARATR
jgi:hypothetical protein